MRWPAIQMRKFAELQYAEGRYQDTWIMEQRLKFTECAPTEKGMLALSCTEPAVELHGRWGIKR